MIGGFGEGLQSLDLESLLILTVDSLKYLFRGGEKLGEDLVVFVLVVHLVENIVEEILLLREREGHCFLENETVFSGAFVSEAMGNNGVVLPV